MEEPSEGVTLRGKKERMVRIVSANYTDEVSFKHTNTLKTVDRDA